MIRSQSEYNSALRQYREQREEIERQRAALVAQGLQLEHLETAMQPVIAFHAQLGEEISWYEGVQRRQFEPARRLADLGRLLIGLRIASGLTQKQLAEKLQVSEAAVSRDERNEYHGITIERAQRIIDALEANVTAQVESFAAR